MSQDSEAIKSVEQWRWSEMQGLELGAPPQPEERENRGRGERREMEASETKPDGAEAEKPSSDLPSTGFFELFRFADSLDYVLMGIGTIGAIVHGSSLPLFLRFFADLVNSFGSNANNIDKMTQEVVKYAFYFLVVGAAIWASSWAEISCWMWTGERQSTKMRIKYLEAALNQDIPFFDTEVRTSDVVFAINTDAVMVQDAISEKLGNFMHYMATFVCGFVVGFTAVWQLALVTLAVVPVIAVIGGIHTTTLSKLSAKTQQALSQAGNIAEQTIAQIRTVLAFVGESRALQAYSSALRTAQRLGYKSGFAKGLGLGATYFTVFCCYALLLWYGGFLVRHHYTNGGLAIATMFAVMIGGLALGQSAPSMAAFAKARVAAAKIFRIIDHKPGVERNSESGQVLLDGHDIKALKLRWLRQQIGLVSQEPALFATTIKENILLGRPDATLVEIEEAARVANAHSFIAKLPDGFDTQVGERGLQLSGGQKQRIAIARAMLKNPAILLLDEATSALDSESEKLVQEALDRFMIGRTTLVIAHRLSTIRKADLVAVLQQGSVSEIGTHDELMAKGENGVYAKLIRMQETAHETALNNARKSSARPSSARNSVSSPIIARNSSYGRSPYSRRLSDFSTSDFSLSLDASHPNYRLEKLAFKEQASSFWRLAKMNSPEWAYALVGSIGSVVCGFLSAFFAYVLSAVLSVYYNPDHAYMIREIRKYCYLLIGVSSAALIFNTLQHFFWDVVGENLTKRVREKMLAAVMKNEMAWFDQEENESSRVAARLALDANNVRSAIGDRISVIMQNSSLMVAACTAGFVLQWRLALVLVAVFPVVVAATVLQRFYEPSSGRVTIDGKDIRKYNLKSLRQHITLVPQEPCLFATTIYENIAYGRESATEAEIIEAATLANAHKFVSSLPDGYKTFVGERGIQMSGGQKQRIALARAFLRKAEIMLLDEATSALDAESERCIQEALERACSGKTTIVVAHRLSTIRNAHVIAVIDDGKVAEQGSHSHLLKNNPDGIYARMIQLQRFTHGQVVSMASGSCSSARPKEDDGREG
ncbi:ABC transporter B family member 1 like [Actinidia chinensis var. chinensis]|uniref:ABC transporter B family member 1 like n=1 Tax=Actinidia chinensis var. chinensis TaxID=1590841 RepID=A0A2R6Q9K4_ACTCC|nr:ABC transporter B family member 1 like [Actinidia chinensis var. chinensis]